MRQEPGNLRRWFESPMIELVVWYDGTGYETGFQLIYRPPRGEGALTWRRCSGFSHHRVDSGDHDPFKNMTPVLLPDGVVPWLQIEDLFRQNAASLDPDLRELVSARLTERR